MHPGDGGTIAAYCEQRSEGERIEDSPVLLLEMIALGVASFAALLGFIAFCDRV